MQAHTHTVLDFRLQSQTLYSHTHRKREGSETMVIDGTII